MRFDVFTRGLWTLQGSTCARKADALGTEQFAGDIASGETPEIGLRHSTLHMSPTLVTALIHRELIPIADIGLGRRSGLGHHKARGRSYAGTQEGILN